MDRVPERKEGKRERKKRRTVEGKKMKIWALNEDAERFNAAELRGENCFSFPFSKLRDG